MEMQQMAEFVLGFRQFARTVRTRGDLFGLRGF